MHLWVIRFKIMWKKGWGWIPIPCSKRVWVLFGLEVHKQTLFPEAERMPLTFVCRWHFVPSLFKSCILFSHSFHLHFNLSWRVSLSKHQFLQTLFLIGRNNQLGHELHRKSDEKPISFTLFLLDSQGDKDGLNVRGLPLLQILVPEEIILSNEMKWILSSCRWCSSFFPLIFT